MLLILREVGITLAARDAEEHLKLDPCLAPSPECQ